ncbi:hypothetical protein DSM21852_10040 [Methylocystis bryophila]|nr:hypothetical protein DSM21852_10040 [Methylocystis bryophila]
MLAQWDGVAAETVERSDAPTTLAEPGFATRIATSAAKSESQDFIARIGAFAAILELNHQTRSETMVTPTLCGVPDSGNEQSTLRRRFSRGVTFLQQAPSAAASLSPKPFANVALASRARAKSGASLAL